ncbi:MAG: penicillin-binding protein 2 [Pseudomonadota bacterium]|nr:cell division protein [Gammaproteobacteria bacterium]MEC8009887.1 penicillin-binding protein 2 [Pseudomonadota bacterium]HBF09740.1 cell division protein [Gammaproteobacteria bacterium]|tara:strand:+ start:29818 stop:31506 length:1689 start_codon:yes stop_codon:yes gene_type:complete
MHHRAGRSRAAFQTGRLWVLLIGLAIAMSAIVGRLVHLQLDESSFLKNQGDRRSLRTVRMPAYRGMIVDRNGRALAVSTPAVNLEANPKVLIQSDPEKLKLLAEAIGWSYSSLQDKLQKYSKKEFMFLVRYLEPDAAEKALGLRLKGLWPRHVYKRHYPAGAVASHVVGLTNAEEEGQEGVELKYEDLLNGVQGKRTVIKDLFGQVVKDLGVVQTPEDGKNLALSLDLRVQYVAHQALEEAAIQSKAKSGSLVAIDVDTGEVLAMANYPSVDPNDRANLRPEALRNRAVTDMFDPGSTAKAFSVLAALESGKFQPWSVIDTSPIKVGRKWIRDHRDYGPLDLTGILMHSSNVGVTKLVLDIPVEKQVGVIRDLGFGMSTQIGLPGETDGYAPGFDLWRPIERATLAYGYGISVSVLQLARAYAVIARGGEQLDLSILQKEERSKGEQVVSKRSSDQVLHMLESVLSDDGTGKNARVPGYRVAGKTGTARKLTSQGYDARRYLSWFAGVAPVSNPKYAVVVMLNDPAGKRFYGGEIAAPVFSNVMESLLRFNGVLPDASLAKK